QAVCSCAPFLFHPRLPGSNGLHPPQRIRGHGCLCYVNLVNYIERYTIAGVLPNIQAYFHLSDGTAALLQTVFICSFLLLAPVFGYLGDRYNRKYIMIAGLIMWTLTSFCCSFITESVREKTCSNFSVLQLWRVIT
uniref:SPNS lysolipid transporter 3, sphingosine-1-phosphate (putative) n=1 Tax=Takifugu rubripes TaxID=31033 RepID=A0A674P9V5_TAKRU